MYTSRPKSIIRIFCCRLINSNLDRVLFYCNSISLFYCDVIINSIFRANQEKNHPILLSSYSAPLCLALRNKQSAYADCLEIKSKKFQRLKLLFMKFTTVFESRYAAYQRRQMRKYVKI